MPHISVLMSVYNGSRYLEQAVQSIIEQTYADFEFIIINDGSTDTSWNILSRFAAKDSRIRLVQHTSRQGLTHSLNEALALAKGAYIARMDADDIAEPMRLQQQFVFMRANPHVAACGSMATIINERGECIGNKILPKEYVRIKRQLLQNNKFVHSSLMFNAKVLRSIGGYHAHFKKSQDYELMLRLAARYPVENLPQPLIRWRLHGASASWMNRTQEWYAIEARALAVWKYGYPRLRGTVHILLRLIWLALPMRLKRLRYEI